MDFKILSTTVLNKIANFSFNKISFMHEKYNGTTTGEFSRVCLDRGDSVAILLVDKKDKTIFLVEQFRVGVAVNPSKDLPWVVETVAGSMDGENESPYDVALREVDEEAPGCKILSVEKIMSYYPSPGACSEKKHLFAAVIDSTNMADFGGLADHNEDIKVIKLPLSDAYDMLDRGEFNTGSLIICLQWFRHKYGGLN